MDAETSSRSLSSHLHNALAACRGAWSHAAKLALDVALPTLCVSCREPVDGEGVCAECWAKLSFIAPPYCPRLGIPFVYDPGPDMLSMEAIASPPAYTRARAAVRYDDVARTLVHALKYQDRTDLAPAMGSFPFRCIGGVDGAVATIKRARWRASSSSRPAYRWRPKRCGGFAARSNRSACRGRNGPAMCRARSRSRPTGNTLSVAAAWC
jgi:hypothetical protein